MQPQAKEHLEAPEAGRDEEGSSLEPSEAVPTADFGSVASRTGREEILVVLGHQVRGNLFWQP